MLERRGGQVQASERNLQDCVNDIVVYIIVDYISERDTNNMQARREIHASNSCVMGCTRITMLRGLGCRLC
jgi:hypothetical protein